ncbi:MAG: glycine cleavage system aminomethyltransferase T/glycine [Verrucomicrobiales bacterium]|jgi:glycine cleavage system aminomethyltransferase T/glycine/D-amino acid oxidase-like deaminating enzyme
MVCCWHCPESSKIPTVIKTLVSNTPVKPESTFPQSELPTSARAVIVGGGIVGASVAYHLSQLGWENIVLLDQGTIGSGSTWHAAGMVGQLRTSNSLTKINKYSVELYKHLQEDLGHDIGWLQVGSLIIGTCEERMSQLRRTAAMAEVFGVEAALLNREEAAEKWPLMRSDDVSGGVWLPHDGRVIPGATAVAMAVEASKRGVVVAEQTRVEEILMNGQRATGVRTNKGEIQADLVILTGGMWTRQLALQVDVDIPLYPVEHHYVLSEPIEGAHRDLPCARDPERAIYFRTLDDGSIKLGAFQARSKPWMVERIPSDFSCGLLEDDWSHFAGPLADGKHRIPALENAAFPKFVNGPESFTPDNQFIMGEPAGFDGLFVLAGFNSVGIASAGGAGKYAAEWLQQGAPTMDLWSVDIRRFAPFQNDRAYLRERVSEVLGLHYQMAWPNREVETARGIRQTPLFAQLMARNACFGSSMGWERANWFAPEGVTPVVNYSFGKQNWAPFVAEEVKGCRENVAIFDQSTFSKFLMQGIDATEVLQQICGANVDVAIGSTVYTSILNERGTFESDLTLVRFGQDEYYIISGTSQAVRDFDWIKRNIPGNADVQFTEITASIGVVSIMGPNARDLLSRVTSADVSNVAFPFATAQELTIDDCSVRAIRISYVGELGWELHAPFAVIPKVYQALVDAGADLSITHAGTYAINAMRLEKAYRAWGHELSTDETPLEAGLGFAIDWTIPFNGREALLKQKETGIRKRLIALVLEDSESTLWGGEPIHMNGKLAGYTTSGAFSPTLDAGIALGYVPCVANEPARALLDGQFHILNDGKSLAATPHLKSPYDPKQLKLKG